MRAMEGARPSKLDSALGKFPRGLGGGALRPGGLDSGRVRMFEPNLAELSPLALCGSPKLGVLVLRIRDGNSRWIN